LAPARANDSALLPWIKPEQTRIQYRDPASLPDIYVPATPPPPTVSSPLSDDEGRRLPLDEAIRLALADSEVIRQLAGTIAVSSGQTIYDPAIANSAIDQQRARFDPRLDVNNTWSQSEPPSASFVPVPPPALPTQSEFGGFQTENHNLSLDVAQTNLGGGTSRLRLGNDASRADPGLFPLNPLNRSATELSYTQPLLRGAGVLANRVPIVLARIDTERSFFQLRDGVQNLVTGTIEAYWTVVSARTDVWARRIQLEQSLELVRFSEARVRTGFADVTEAAQAQSAAANFRASVIGAEANLLAREAALQNILGMPPTMQQKLVPSTPPTSERIDFDWNEVTQIAQSRRPDLIELKLILEADQQRLLLARNDARPNLDLVALYRWNGLEGRMPDGTRIGTGANDATDWTLGVNFSVPLFLRQERAAMRSAELFVARDRAVLEQGIHSARHILAQNFRNLDAFYAQYDAFRAARQAAQQNLQRQYAAYRTGNPVLFVNVLQAISDWGNSVSQEAQSLTQYNIELARLERESGTILETHGVFFYEDRFCSLGPLWACPNSDRPYPRDLRPSANQPRYGSSDEPSENFFDLDNYPRRRAPRDQLPPPSPPPGELPPLPGPAPSGPSDPSVLPSPAKIDLQLPASVRASAAR
jgi:outer membrane protein TolC